MIPASRQRNYLQSALYVAIVGVLSAILLERLLTYAEVAEKAAMEATIGNLHAALYTRLVEAAVRGDAKGVAELEQRSPFLTTKALSRNYLGSLAEAPPAAEAEGKWYFDRSRRELVYRPNLDRYFRAPATREARYRVQVLRADSGAYVGVALVPVFPILWEPGP